MTPSRHSPVRTRAAIEQHYDQYWAGMRRRGLRFTLIVSLALHLAVVGAAYYIYRVQTKPDPLEVYQVQVVEAPPAPIETEPEVAPEPEPEPPRLGRMP